MIDIFSVIFLSYIFAGCIGGLIRGLVGIRKEILKKTKNISYSVLIVSILLAGIIGGFASIFITEGNILVAFLAGYGGSDFLDNLYKTKFFRSIK